MKGGVDCEYLGRVLWELLLDQLLAAARQAFAGKVPVTLPWILGLLRGRCIFPANGIDLFPAGR